MLFNIMDLMLYLIVPIKKIKMKKGLIFTYSILIISLFLNSCGNSNEINNNTPDLCRCLNEPGNSQWNKDNKLACRNLISNEIGVENWEKINFSKNPKLNREWDLLVEKCTGSKKVKTGIDLIDKNNELVPEIGTSYGFIWEYIDVDTQLYTTLAFDGLIFRQSAYLMNGESNSDNFTKIIDLSGKWKAIDSKNAEGVIEVNNVSVSWSFSSNYTTLTNNKGVVFNRVKVN